MESYGLDVSNENSLVALVSDKFRESISKIPPELLNRTQDDIIKLAYDDYPDLQPPGSDIILRRALWDEYNRAIASGSQMVMSNIYRDTMQVSQFYELLRLHPKRLAFLLTQPQSDKNNSRAILELSWKQMRKIMLAEPEIDKKTGLPDSSALDRKLKLFIYLDQRENGLPIQRIHQKTTSTNTNLNVGIDANPTVKGLSPAASEDEVNRLLEEVKQRLLSTPSAPVPMIAKSDCKTIEPKLVLPVESSYRDAKKAEVKR